MIYRQLRPAETADGRPVYIARMSSSYVVLVQLTALPEWLQLDRGARQQVIETRVQPVLDAYPECRVRWIDTEALTAVCSDLMLVETTDLERWYHLWEGIRDTPIFSVPYFQVEAIIPGIEDGYVAYELAG